MRETFNRHMLLWRQLMKKTALFLMLFVFTISSLQATPILSGDRAVPVEAKNGMVVTSHAVATDAALAVLKQGGNAIDAAVTAGFVLAVTQPRSGNIGGGGFMLISSEKKNEVISIDYREKAPAAASRDMFLDKADKVDSELSRFSHRSAGVPGTVAGFAFALEQYGTLSLAEALAPAIALAEKGFSVPSRFAQGVQSAQKRLFKYPAGKKKFKTADGNFYEPGNLFRQPALAETLKRIAKNGSGEFYTGRTAELIVAEMQQGGGLITLEDLRNYQPEVRTPVHGTYRGYDVYSMGPPSSGGVHIVQLLNILEGYPISEAGLNSAQTIHFMAEAMKRAYADRAQFLGDPDFVTVPTSGLMAKKYASHLRSTIDRQRASNSSDIRHGSPAGSESNETTHFSIVDRFGNAVSNTYTINFSYGSGIVVEGAGFLLNNEMDDFSAKPGVPNAYGLVGGEANQIAPNKRTLSSMSPTIVKKEGKNYLVTGSPGGSRIITTTLQVIMNVVDHQLNPLAAVSSPRIHHQWLPDEIRIEQGISADTINLLRAMGHTVKENRAMGASQTIVVGEDGTLYGGADPRRSTSSARGY